AVGRAWSTAEAVDAAVALASRLVGADGGAPAEIGSGVRLTARERDVLRLVVDGHQDPAIAEILGLSPRTVSEHVGNLLKKCGQPNRTALAVYAVRHRVV
ncbi:MAG: hypothetical protein QOF33_701, partial [Thermomicrobiales bacterium]|nr:hypothetical protein [Thermomicrobiales bacterium]